MNRFAHFFLVGFAVAIMSLFAALALSQVLDERVQENAQLVGVTAATDASTAH